MNITTNETTFTVGQCTATCIAKTLNLYTFELVYPRIIHSEFMTHRMFSRNAMSSRATPAKVLIEDVLKNPYVPRYILGNKSGMVGEDTLTEDQKVKFIAEYNRLVGYTCQKAIEMNALGVHKNLINRLIEPFSFMKTIVTATDWDNFFNLRTAPDAEPNMQDLANAIIDSMDKAAELANAGETFEYTNDSFGFHLPYITDEEYFHCYNDMRQLMKVSAARCARVSYYTHKNKVPTLEEDLALYERLRSNKHMSPLEHPCIVYGINKYYYNLRGCKSLRYIVSEEED